MTATVAEAAKDLERGLAWRGKAMRKFVLITLLLIVLVAAGFISARVRRTGFSVTPHTITYRLTFFDESGKLVTTDVLIRRVSGDGSWKHLQIHEDGSVQHSS